MDFVPDYYNDLSVKLRRRNVHRRVYVTWKKWRVREYERDASGDLVSPHLSDFRNFIVFYKRTKKIIKQNKIDSIEI